MEHGMNIKPVPNWRDSWRWLSVQLSIIGVALEGAIVTFPAIHDWLGERISHCVGILILAGVVAGRLKDQTKQEK
jgi:hypothetical protein